MTNHSTKLFANKYKLFVTGILIFISGLMFSSCSTTGKAGKRKNCDCPRWSNIDKPINILVKTKIPAATLQLTVINLQNSNDLNGF